MKALLIVLGAAAWLNGCTADAGAGEPTRDVWRCDPYVKEIAGESRGIEFCEFTRNGYTYARCLRTTDGGLSCRFY